MGQTEISETNRALIDIVWHFGPRGLNGECCGNLAMPEFLALEKVADTADCPVQEIGLRLGFTKSGATRIVSRLEKKGYVRRVRSDKDARICCVHITSRGKEILNSVDHRYTQELERLLSKMPDQAGETLRGLLKAMAEALE